MTVLTVDDNNESYTIDNIPSGVMEKFSERARLLMPDAGDDAWAAMMTEFIVSVSRDDESTIHLTGIPNECYNSLQNALNTTGETIHGLVSRLLQSAQDGRFHVIKYMGTHEEELTGHAVVFVGYPDEMMKVASERAHSVYDKTVEECLGSIMLSFAHREVKDAGQKS